MLILTFLNYYFFQFDKKESDNDLVNEMRDLQKKMRKLSKENKKLKQEVNDQLDVNKYLQTRNFELQGQVINFFDELRGTNRWIFKKISIQISSTQLFLSIICRIIEAKFRHFAYFFRNDKTQYCEQRRCRGSWPRFSKSWLWAQSRWNGENKILNVKKYFPIINHVTFLDNGFSNF